MLMLIYIKNCSNLIFKNLESFPRKNTKTMISIYYHMSFILSILFLCFFYIFWKFIPILIKAMPWCKRTHRTLFRQPFYDTTAKELFWVKEKRIGGFFRLKVYTKKYWKNGNFFKTVFISNGLAAHVVKKQSGKNSFYCEIRYRANEYNFTNLSTPRKPLKNKEA